MLQKGEGGTKGAQRATAAFPLVNTSDPRSTLEALQTQRGEEGAGAGAGPSSAAEETPADIMALLADRNKAFEHFRRSYRRNEAIEENKALLKEKYGGAVRCTSTESSCSIASKRPVSTLEPIK
jgi:hypothetical protein